MFSVESGETEKSVSKTYKGEVDGLLPQIQVVAWELVGLQAPADLLAAAGVAAPAEEVAEAKPKKKGSGKFLRNTAIVLLLAGGGYYAYMMMGEEDLPMPPDPPTGGGSMIMIRGGK